MIQLVIDNKFIDLYETDLPRITLQFDSFESFQPASDYSQTFRVPATENNFQFFSTVFEVNGIDFDVTVRREAQILVNGQEFVSGEIRLNKIYIDGTKIDYEVFFLGNTRNLVTQIGNKTLNQLNLVAYNHTASISDMIDLSWNAFPAFGYDAGLDLGGDTLPGDIIYPLVDFGNTYDEDYNPEQVEIAVGEGFTITSASVAIPDKLYTDRFRPMIRVNAVFKQIFNDAGFNVTGSIFDGALPIFYRTYVSAWGNDDVVSLPASNENLAKASLTENFIVTTNSRVAFNSIDYDNSDNWNETLYEYVAPVGGDYTFNISLIGGIYIPAPGTDADIQITKISGGVVSNFQINTYDTDGFISYNKLQTLTLLAGDKITITVFSNGPTVTLTGGYFRVNAAPGDTSISALLDDEYKQIDFIKDIAKKFKLVIVPDRYDSTLFHVNPWREYIATGDVYDWTNILDTSKTIQIEPLFNNQPQNITFQDKADKDWLNDLNEKNFKEPFGTLQIDTDNDLLKGDKKIETNLSPTPVSEIQFANGRTTGNPDDGMDNFIIPHIYQLESAEKEDGTIKLLKKPIKPKTRILFYNGQIYTGRSVAKTNDWYYNDGNGATGFKNYCTMMSYYAAASLRKFNGIEAGDIGVPVIWDLNWQVENGYLRLSTPPDRSSMYDYYWTSYIADIYNKYSRRLTANFILSAEDLNEFKFSDVIFVKDTYFYVEKIENVPLGEKSSTRVSLIKLNNYVVPQGGFIPLGDNWEDININWENLTGDNWENL